MTHRSMIGTLWVSLLLLLVGCASEAGEQTEVAISATPTSVPTTAPLSAPTPTSVPTPTSTALPLPTSTALPTPLPAASPTSTVAPTDPLPTPTPLPDSTPNPTAAPTPTTLPTATALATTVPTPTGEPEAGGDASEVEPTQVEETPTAAVVPSGEPPLECYDREVQVYRGFVDGVDALSFEGGRVYCSGAGTNAVSAAGSYRHSSGLIVQRNADFIFNNAGTAYIPYSGSVHFCINAQPASAPVRADTVPALLVVIDAEAQRQVAQGASGPASFTASGAQC